MSDLSDAIVGTKIKVPEQYGSRFSVHVVTNVTTANVVCDKMRFRKTDGLLIGSGDGFGRRFAHIASDADILTHRIARAKSRLCRIEVTVGNLETVERLVAESEAAQ